MNSKKFCKNSQSAAPIGAERGAAVRRFWAVKHFNNDFGIFILSLQNIVTHIQPWHNRGRPGNIFNEETYELRAICQK